MKSYEEISAAADGVSRLRFHMYEHCISIVGENGSVWSEIELDGEQVMELFRELEHWLFERNMIDG